MQQNLLLLKNQSSVLPDGSYEAVVYTDAVHRKDWAFSSCMKKKKRQKIFETDKFFMFSIVIY